MLPQRTYEVELPSDADLDTLSVEIMNVQSEELSGTYGIRYGPYAATGMEDYEVPTGENSEIYDSDSNYPNVPAMILGTYQSNENKVARVLFSPFQYNPVTGRLVLNTEVEIRIVWQTKLMLKSRVMALRDIQKDGYVIVTTDAILDNSQSMESFIEHQTTLGYQVYVATEADYGSEEGQDRAVNIRNWLKENADDLGLMYVLLVGDPDPDNPSLSDDPYGDVPMMMCWPRMQEETNRNSPTDYYYADLSGDWDSNGNGFFGEYGVDAIDLGPELYVGRIPVYGADYAALDAILEKYIFYAGTDSSMLLPMAISNYENEDYYDVPRVDGLDLPEYVIENICIPNGYDSYVLYEREGIDPVPKTAYGYDHPLTKKNVLKQWKKDYGIVLWWGHGTPFDTYGKYWAQDDGDDIPEIAEMEWVPFISNTDEMPQSDTFVFQVSCWNGCPEEQDNIGSTLLKNGALCTVSSSRVSWYMVATWADWGIADNAGIGYAYVDRLVNDRESAGVALYEAKCSLDVMNEAQLLMNLFDFNLYGDPSLYLRSSASMDSTLASSHKSYTETSLIEIEMTVDNDGQADALNVVPILKTSGTGTLELVESPDPAIVPGMSSTEFIWTFIATGKGEVSFSGSVEGTDANSGLDIFSQSESGITIAITQGKGGT